MSHTRRLSLMDRSHVDRIIGSLAALLALCCGLLACTDDTPALPGDCAAYARYQGGRTILDEGIQQALFDPAHERLLLVTAGGYEHPGALYAVDLRSGAVSKLVEPATQVRLLGPDGALLVTHRADASLSPLDALTVVRADNSVLPLANRAPIVEASADGRRLLMPGPCQEAGPCASLFVVYVDEAGRSERLFEGPISTEVAVSPSGDRVAFLSVESDRSETARAVSLPSGALQTLATNSGRGLHFLSSGRLLLGVATTPSTPPGTTARTQLMVAAPTAAGALGPPAPLGPPASYAMRDAGNYVISSDERWVLAAELTRWDQPSTLWAVGLDGGADVKLSDGFFPSPGQSYSQPARFDPSGQTVAYLTASQQLATVPRSGGASALLADGVSYVGFRFVPGSTDELVIGQSGGKGVSGLMLASVARGPLRQILATGKPLQWLTLLADGRGALVTDSRVTGPSPQDLRYVPLSGAASTLVGERVPHGTYAVDPAGCAAVFGSTSSDPTSSGGPASTRTVLTVLPR